MKKNYKPIAVVVVLIFLVAILGIVSHLENSFSPELIREREPILSREDEMAEFMFLGLRMTEGVARTDFEQIFGCCIEQIYGDVLKKYESMGLLQEKNGRIFLSRAGIHVSNSVMADFLL